MKYNNRHDDIPVESIDSSEVLDLVQNVFAQMYNGGFLHLCENGFTDKLVDLKNEGFALNEIKMHLSRYNFSKEKNIFNGLKVIYDILEEYEEPIDHPCEYCDGQGFENDTEVSCGYCDGSGTIVPSRWKDVEPFYNEDFFKKIDKDFIKAVPYEVYEELIYCDEDIEE